mmetsp:Transcript_41107/g.102682  ORF Transcript_41107/g.102682 Transcript_41107/m.102682 type:complete len:257 (-) Transcript_41107:2183-2953(-)
MDGWMDGMDDGSHRSDVHRRLGECGAVAVIPVMVLEIPPIVDFLRCVSTYRVGACGGDAVARHLQLDRLAAHLVRPHPLLVVELRGRRHHDLVAVRRLQDQIEVGVGQTLLRILVKPEDDPGEAVDVLVDLLALVDLQLEDLAVVDARPPESPPPRIVQPSVIEPPQPERPRAPQWIEALLQSLAARAGAPVAHHEHGRHQHARVLDEAADGRVEVPVGEDGCCGGHHWCGEGGAARLVGVACIGVIHGGPAALRH